MRGSREARGTIGTMPQSSLSADRVFRLLGRELSEEDLREALFRSKVEFHGRKDGLLDLEVTPDRLDLLDEGGLAWELQGILNLAGGLPYAPEPAPRPGVEAHANPTVSPLRPELVMATASAPPGQALDAGDLEELVRFQELLHATLGRDRVAASLGLYPLERIQPPFRYVLEPLDQIRFVPLGGSEEMGGREFYATHSMAETYGSLGRSEGLALTLRDSRGTILSLPPVLNAAGPGELRPGDREILIEATGTRLSRTREMVGMMLLPFAARGWKIHPVPIHRSGNADPGREAVEPRTLPVSSGSVAQVLGIRLTGPEMEKGLLAARLGVDREGTECLVRVPPWRPDILSSLDVVEDLAVAHGFASLSPVLPVAPSPGRTLPFRRFLRRWTQAALGLGFQEIYTPLLMSREAAERFSPPAEALRLSNPVSREFSHLRPVLRATALDFLGRTTGQGYPQRIFEVGPVVVRDPSSETGTRTDVHGVLLEAGKETGFARAAGILEYLTRLVGIQTSREPVDSPGTIRGRAARVRWAGEDIAVCGEVFPAALAELRIPEPVAFVEMNLSQIWSLRGTPRAPGTGSPSV